MLSTGVFVPKSKNPNKLKNPSQEFRIRNLREKLGMSQRVLGEKMGIEQSRVSRLESRACSDLTLGELKGLSTVFGYSLHDLIQRMQDPAKIPVSLGRSSLKMPFFSLDFGSDAKILSLSEAAESHFVGALQLNPQKTLAAEKAPRAEMLFYFVVHGIAVLTQSSKESVFKEGEAFSLNCNISYELYNPHPILELTLLLVTLPSFVRFKS